MGLVSCMLEYALLVSPSSVEAAELDSNNQVVAEEAETKEEAITNNENVAEEEKVENIEAPAEESVEEKSSEEATPQEASEEDKKEENASELEMAEETKPEAVSADPTEEDAITNVEITIGGAKNGEKTEIVNPTALPERTNGGNTDINLEARVDFDIPEGTKAGKTFDFVVSDNVNLHGVLKSEEEGQPVVFDGEEIATAERLTDGRNGYKYTFNEKVDGLKDIRARIIYPLLIDPDKVPMGTKEYEIGEDGKYVLDGEGNPVLKADNKEKVSVTVAGKTASKDYTVEYESEVFDIKSTGPTLSGISDIDKVDDNNYNHTIYVNPTADQLLNGSHVTVQNEKGYKTVTFDEEVKNSVKVYKVKNPNKLPLSFGNKFDDGNYEDVTNKAEVRLVKDDNNADLSKLVVDVKQGNTNESMPFDNKDFDSSVYVVTYTGKRTPNKAFKTNTIFTADWRKANGNAKNLSKLGDQSWKWTNEIVIDDADAIAIANRTYSLGDKVWVDADNDGSQGDSEKGLANVKVILKGINISDKETKTDADGKYKFEGLKNGEYTVEFEIPAGYAPTTAKAENVKDEKNSDASQAEGAKVATATGIINGADNMNVDFGVIKVAKGTFTEHHIYKEYKDGELINTSKIDIDKTEGTEKESFTTSAKPNGTDKDKKEGFKLVPGEITKSNEITEKIDGSAPVKANYINDKNLEVTYVYRKDTKSWTPIEEKGKFQEHHIYITKDKNGKEIKRDVVPGKVSGGTKDMTYETGKKEKDGFKFVRTENPVDNPSYNGKGETKEGNFKPGVKQEITYVYEKTETPWTPLEPSKPVEEKGSFQEHHIYITKDKDGKEIKREVVDGKVTDGTKDMTYTTGKVEKDKFKFVRVENLVEDPTYDKDGNETKGNYKPGVKQEITYVYEKIVTPWTELQKPRKQEKPSNSNETDKKIVKENKTNDDIYKVKYVKPSSTSDNVQTGISSLSGIIATLSAPLGGLIVSKKRKNK